MEVNESLWSELPQDLLESIALRMCRADRVRFLAVCKGWQRIRKYIIFKPSVHIGPIPCLLHKIEKTNRFRVYVPWYQLEGFLVRPELENTQFRFSKAAWLILYNPTNYTICSFNPFSRNKIDLPSLKLPTENCSLSFSSLPESEDCIVLIIQCSDPESVTISTCCFGDEAWTTNTYPNNLPFQGILENPIFLHGVFYCFDLNGGLGIFDPNKSTWTVIELINVPGSLLPECYHVEFHGDLLAITKKGRLQVFRLDLYKREWETVRDLGDGVLFTGLATSISSSTRIHPNICSNSVYIPVLLEQGRLLSRGSYYQRYPLGGAMFNFLDARQHADPYEVTWTRL